MKYFMKYYPSDEEWESFIWYLDQKGNSLSQNAITLYLALLWNKRGSNAKVEFIISDLELSRFTRMNWRKIAKARKELKEKGLIRYRDQKWHVFIYQIMPITKEK
ncbi:type 1 periplasmic-binding domain-containing protein [Ornithinibacillus halophilus]|uniref:Helix-turn-helix domain-containing protein n=1 Tax=Ornithinibacillus halophilus TaxID=930117 RepID=A0A1M5GK31_9BACI|nr:hypothetical protein [Ornithinibacillus halophilus]SHG03881.1 hypothetical protein SAMN05216225_101338 [Ornithinibacillus halophilus]